jgi:hypothetical protein
MPVHLVVQADILRFIDSGVFAIREQRTLIFPVALWPKAVLGIIILENSKSHLLDAPQMVGVL